MSSKWVVFTQEVDDSIDRVWVFEDDGTAAAWLAGQRKLNRKATMVKAPVVKARKSKEKAS